MSPTTPKSSVTIEYQIGSSMFQRDKMPLGVAMTTASSPMPWSWLKPIATHPSKASEVGYCTGLIRFAIHILPKSAAILGKRQLIKLCEMSTNTCVR